jgi:hypothetical protein
MHLPSDSYSMLVLAMLAHYRQAGARSFSHGIIPRFLKDENLLISFDLDLCKYPSRTKACRDILTTRFIVQPECNGVTRDI